MSLGMENNGVKYDNNEDAALDDGGAKLFERSRIRALAGMKIIFQLIVEKETEQCAEVARA